MQRFKTTLAETIFRNKYALDPQDTWDALAERVVSDVCGTSGGTMTSLLPKDELDQLVEYIKEMKFIPGGRYLYYAGRRNRFWNNCFLEIAQEDTREEWARLVWWAMRCLTVGGGIGIDYSVFRPHGMPLKGTGGIASGPIPLMFAINEIGRNVIQGGSRRSAIFASLNWQHADIPAFLKVKDWDSQETKLIYYGKEGTHSFYSYGDLKRADFNAPCPLDMTNISINYDNKAVGAVFRKSPNGPDTWELNSDLLLQNEVFLANCFQAMRTGEPGFSFNFRDKEKETARNACCEVTSEDGSDCCNLGSVNLSAVKDIKEFKDVVSLGTKFLLCGSIRADLPTEKSFIIREKNRRLGLGLMGMHEWLLRRGYQYEVVPELHSWLEVYRDESRKTADQFSEKLGVSRPVACRAIAPTGTIGMLASTTTGIEPLYAVAYKRRYLDRNNKYHYQYEIDMTAEHLIQTYGIDPDSIETARSLAIDFERRIKFQADVQDYVDMAISSTINLPQWGSKHNNEDLVTKFAASLAKYAPRLRGFTCYPDQARGGQPIVEVDYKDAKKHRGVIFQENDICSITNKGGVCGE